tara:strand:+ start:4600 stop:5274 length:675 start_codon:yes stop_codon:yes gene_type:complete
MSYLTFGEGQDLILGHGMAQNKNLWLENGWVKELSKIRRVHIFDFPGHGDNLDSDESNLSVQEMANYILEIGNDINCESFDYIGFSMGARAGFELASYNNNLKKIISLGMHPGAPYLEAKRFNKRAAAMKNLGEKTGEKKYIIYSKIFEKALDWEGAIHKINWENEKHKIIIGEKDDNYKLTKSIMKEKNNKVLHTLKGVNHKNTFNEPKHSMSAIINFLQDSR